MCWASTIGSQHDATRICCWAARGRLQEISIDSWYAAPALAAVDRYLLHAGRSAANQPHAAAAVGRRNRQMDGRTEEHPTVT